MGSGLPERAKKFSKMGLIMILIYMILIYIPLIFLRKFVIELLNGDSAV